MHKALDKVLASLGADWDKSARKKIRQACILRQTHTLEPPPIWGSLREDDSIELLRLFVRMHLAPNAICAGLLLSPLEAELLTEVEIQEQFGKKVAQLCLKVKALPSFSFAPPRDKKERSTRYQEHIQAQAESFRRMLFAIAQDLRVVMLRLTLRVHQLRNLGFVLVEQQMSVAQECREICAPLANRLGISWLKNELEDLSLRFLYPHDFYHLATQLSSTRGQRDSYILEVQNTLEGLVQEYDIRAEVGGRSKHINSIFRKLKRRNMTFEQLFDIAAFRVICDTKEQCYQLLGLIHARWTPVPGRFKDYIALPKSNHYQSLHTTVVGPQNKRMEVQIRTFEMHRIAEDGIAAHWLYKESGGSQPGEGVQDVQWLRSLLYLQDEKSDDDEFMASVQDHLFEERVFAFTPKGDVKELMFGATPLDFAYAIHSEVGMRCVGAKVNGKMVSLRHTLKNGDLVEIKTSPSAQPNRGHLEFAKTGRAQTKIRSFLRQTQRDQAVQMGRTLLEKELPSSRGRLSKLIKTGVLLEAAQTLGWNSNEELFMQVGYGKLGAQAVLEVMFPPEDTPTPAEEELEFFEPKPRRHRKHAKTSGILVDGMDGILVKMARCCNPIPGDAIVGFISRGRGATIHTRSCSKIQELDPARQIDVSWANSQATKHSVILRIVSENRTGLLTQISRVFSDNDIDISSARCQTSGEEAINVFQCYVSDVEQLRRLSQQIKNIRGVIRVDRLRR